MEPHIRAIEDYAQILNEAKQAISMINDLPEHFKSRSTRSLGVLAAAALSAAGLPSDPGNDEPAFEVKPITEMFGRSVVPQSRVPVAQVAPSETLIEDFRKRCAELIDVFRTQSPKQFLDNCSESEIRGVAKQLGMSDVSSTYPERIDLEFVREMKDLLEHNDAQEQANEQAANARQESQDAAELAKEESIEEQMVNETQTEAGTEEKQDRPQIAPKKPGRR